MEKHAALQRNWREGLEQAADGVVEAGELMRLRQEAARCESDLGRMADKQAELQELLR